MIRKSKDRHARLALKQAALVTSHFLVFSHLFIAKSYVAIYAEDA